MAYLQKLWLSSYFSAAACLLWNNAKLSQHHHNNCNKRNKKLSTPRTGSRWKFQAPAKGTMRTSICENASD